MALNVFELFGKIVVDHSGAEKGIDKTVKHARDAESNLSKTFKKIGGMVAAAFSVRAVVDFGKQCTQAYASIAAEESAFAQIMGDYADTAQAKLNAVSDATGVSATRMTGAMTSLTAKFKGLGYDVEDATTLAADGLLIASDAAAFWDMSLDESMSHLNSFINGSYEGGEAIGLFANDTQMAAYAIEQGIVKDAKAWAKLDEAQRQATRLDYAKKMMADSGATGQAAKEADSYANVMANLKESWRQFQGVVGKPILEKLVLPAMQKLNNFLPKLTEGVQNGIVWLEEGFGKVKGYFEEVFTEDGINLDALPDALSNMFRDLGRSVGSLLNSFGQKLKAGWNNTVWPTIQKTFKAVFGIELPDWATVKQNISDGWNNTVWPAVQGLFKAVFGVELPSWSQLVTDITNGWNNKVWPAIKDFFSPLFTVNPEDEKNAVQRIIDWYNNKVKPGLAGLFEETFEVKPEDADGTEVGKKIRDWFELCKAACGDVFKATFHVDPGDGYEVGKNIRDMMDKVNATIGDVFTKLFTVVPKDIDGEETAATLLNWWDTVEKITGLNVIKGFFGVEPGEEPTATAQKIVNWFNQALTYIGDIFKGFFGIEPKEDAETTAAGIVTWWANVTKDFGESMFNFASGIDLPSIDEVVAAIKKWWDEVINSISLKLSIAFPNLFGTGEGEGGEGKADPWAGWKAFESSFSLPEDNGDGGGNPYTVPKGYFFNPAEGTFTRPDGTGGSTGTGSLAGMLTQLLSNQKADIIAAAREGVAEGLSGVTITANVTAGDVNIDGKKAGSMIAPWVDLELGWKPGR